MIDENFFYEEHFCSDLDDLMTSLELEEDELKDLSDGWSVEIEEATKEKIFALKKEDIVSTIVEYTETWEDRFPEESDAIFKRISFAISAGIDIDKINSLLPSLYYPNRTKHIITKNDLIAWCK